MTAPAPPAASLIDDLLLRWQEGHERGRRCPAELLCADHPEVLEQVRERIAALEAMHALLGLGPAAPRARAPHLLCAGPAGELPAVPGYEVLALLDEGGMGTVYRARQPALQRQVAIKMVRAGRHA